MSACLMVYVCSRGPVRSMGDMCFAGHVPTNPGRIRCAPKPASTVRACFDLQDIFHAMAARYIRPMLGRDSLTEPSDTPNRWEALIFCDGNKPFCCQKAVEGGTCCDRAQLRFDSELPTDVMAALRSPPTTTTPSLSRTTPTRFSSGAATSSAAVSSPPAATSTPRADGGTLGRKIGIIVGSVGGVLAVLILATGIALALWLRKRRVRKHRTDGRGHGMTDISNVSADDGQNGNGYSNVRVELDATDLANHPTQNSNPD